MASSKAGKWAVIVMLLGVIVLAILWRKQKQERRQKRKAGTVSAIVKRVETGQLPLTGSSDAWTGVNRFPLWKDEQEKDAENDWKAVWLAHDGANLYALLEFPYVIEEKAPQGKATRSFGWILLDTDRDATTGSQMGSGQNAIGVDRQITLVVQRASESDPLCAGYYVQQARKNKGPKDIGGWITSCSNPDLVGYEANQLAIAVPFSRLDLSAPADIIFAFDPFGGSGTRQYRLELPQSLP